MMGSSDIEEVAGKEGRDGRVVTSAVFDSEISN
jgi:hypothetical protein